MHERECMERPSHVHAGKAWNRPPATRYFFQGKANCLSSHVTFLSFDFLIYKLLLIMSNYVTHTSKNINNYIFECDPSCSVMDLLFLFTFIYLYLFFDQSTISPIPTQVYNYQSTYIFDWSYII